MGRALGLALAVAGVAACGGGAHEDAGAPIAVRDAAGRRVVVDSPARRVVALIPAATEMVVRLGAADRIVARTDYDDEPELAGLPSVGGGLTPSLEWLVARRPELVVAWPDNRSREVVARLAASGIAVYAARMETLADIRGTLQDLGTLLGLRARADSLLTALDAQLDSVRTSTAGGRRPRVVYIESHDPPLVVGAGTYLDELIAVAGGDNVFGDASAPWPRVSLEEVVARAPEVAIVPVADTTRPDTAWLRSSPGWRDLPAVRSGRVYVVDEDRFSRPGLGVGALAARLGHLLHR